MVRFGAWLLRPFGVSLDYTERTPRKSVRRHQDEVLYQEVLPGAIYLTPIHWYKIANMATEVGGGSRFLGKPYHRKGRLTYGVYGSDTSTA